MATNDDFVDLYDLLGVEPDAAKTQLRKAYLRKSRELHPDKNPDPNAGEGAPAACRHRVPHRFVCGCFRVCVCVLVGRSCRRLA